MNINGQMISVKGGRTDMRDEIAKQAFDKSWIVLDEKPVSTISKKKSKFFRSIHSFKYLEANGDTVNLQIENGVWVDHFIDGTYSKLKMEWIDHRTFNIVFIESDNEIRKNFSQAGDSYTYQIITLKEGYFEMSLAVIDTDKHLKFKLYY